MKRICSRCDDWGTIPVGVRVERNDLGYDEGLTIEDVHGTVPCPHCEAGRTQARRRTFVSEDALILGRIDAINAETERLVASKAKRLAAEQAGALR